MTHSSSTPGEPEAPTPPITSLPTLIGTPPSISYHLARLAVKYGAKILPDDLIARLSADCPWRDEPRETCGARFEDLPARRPPDLPSALRRFRVVRGGKA